ncbi:MAG: hypothetical protein NZ518_10925 [Dehalococcoidia bacterium]|nr:hypothetical protein [Dehalococcoidia bacterium]
MPDFHARGPLDAEPRPLRPRADIQAALTALTDLIESGDHEAALRQVLRLAPDAERWDAALRERLILTRGFLVRSLGGMGKLPLAEEPARDPFDVDE